MRCAWLSRVEGPNNSIYSATSLALQVTFSVLLLWNIFSSFTEPFKCNRKALSFLSSGGDPLMIVTGNVVWYCSHTKWNCEFWGLTIFILFYTRPFMPVIQELTRCDRFYPNCPSFIGRVRSDFLLPKSLKNCTADSLILLLLLYVHLCTAGSRSGSPSSRVQPQVVPAASRVPLRNASPTRLYGNLHQQSKAVVYLSYVMFSFSSVLWHCWLGDRKGIRPVKSWVLVCWWWWFDWSFARLIAPVVTTHCLHRR